MENLKFKKLLQYLKEGKKTSVTGESLTLSQYEELCQYATADYQQVLKSRIYKVPEASSIRL